MSDKLAGKTIAIVVGNGFEQIEMTQPRQALEAEGAATYLVSTEKDEVRAWKHREWGDTFEVDVSIDKAKPEEFDALLIPGGVMNPDQLRTDKDVLAFVRSFFDAGKPVAAICHGPWVLIDAGVLEGRRVTSWPSIRADLRNAGAEVLDQEVVVDNGLVTSRKPDDIPAFNQKMIEEFAEGAHRGDRPTAVTQPSL
jgi:protease I